MNLAFSHVEKLSFVAGQSDPDMFCQYIPRLREYLNPDTGDFDGSYGPRIGAQLDYVFSLLTADPASRRAVVSIYSQDDEHESLDVPCAVSIQFLLRSGCLDVITYMRSNDVYLGLPYNVAAFCFLQEVMAGWLSVDVGRYVHVIGSAHLYESDAMKITRVLDRRNDLRNVTLPEFCLSREETRKEISVFFELEKRLRNGALRDDDLGEETSFHEISAELRWYVTEVGRYLARRR